MTVYLTQLSSESSRFLGTIVDGEGKTRLTLHSKHRGILKNSHVRIVRLHKKATGVGMLAELITAGDIVACRKVRSSNSYTKLGTY